MNLTDRVQVKEKRRDHAKVSSPSSEGPEQIFIGVGVCSYETAVRQHHIGFHQAVDGQSILPREIAVAAAQR